MTENVRGMRIAVTADGPYMVSGNVPLYRSRIAVDEKGESIGWESTEQIPAGERYALCRCGRSAAKPFCDGSHTSCGFDGTETAGHGSFAEMAVDIDGPGAVLKDARRLCAEARFCARGAKLWHLIEQCDDPDARALAIEEATLCPSGRYVLCEGDPHVAHEPDLEPSIVVIEDPYKRCSGSLFVRGGIPILDSDGVPYEARNRVALCRCGGSANKPFCDGTHLYGEVKFVDDTADWVDEVAT